MTFVAPRVAGQVSKVLVDDNYRVKKGDLLVQLDEEPFQVQVAIKQAAVAAAETDLVAANAEVHVFAPGEPNRPALTGKTDSDGKFEFGADRDGFWSAEARNGDEVARAMVRVGSQEQQTEPLSPYWLFGGLLLLLVIALAYRILRARARRGPRRPSV